MVTTLSLCQHFTAWVELGTTIAVVGGYGEGLMRQLRTAGWVVLGLAVLAAAAVVTAGALTAHGTAQFDRWAGWATVAAVPVAAVGVMLMLWEKIASGRAVSDRAVAETANELAKVALAQGQVARARLIGTDLPGDRAANVSFVKSSGRFREVGGAKTGDLGSVLEYFQSLSPRRLVVLGEPGAGKTVLAMELALRLLERRADERDPVPVLVSATTYNTKRDWEDWLAGHLAQRFNIVSGIAQLLVRDGLILPVVDGLDEMDSPGDQPRARALVEALNKWIRGRDRAPVVVTCRYEEYRSLGRGVDRATHVKMMRLTGAEAAGYLNDQFLDDDERRRWHRVVTTLCDNPGGLLAGQLATPWRLTLAITVFRDSSSNPTELLPQIPGPDEAALYTYPQRINRLLLNRYVAAAVRLHDPAGRYSPEDVERWLTAIADGLAWQKRHELSGTDLRLDQWWRSVGHRATRVTHIFLVALVALTWFTAAVKMNRAGYTVIGLALLPVIGVALSTPDPKRLALRRLLGDGIPDLALGFVLGAVIGAGSALVLGILLGLVLLSMNGFELGLMSGFAGGIVFGLAYGLAQALADDSPQALGPREVIRSDGWYRLAVVLAVVLAFGLTGGYIFGVAFGLAGGLLFGLAFGLAVGGGVWPLYLISVVIICARRTGPMQYASFLDWAAKAGLLRVSGVTYQFRHRLLQDWLTSPKPTESVKIRSLA